MTEMIHQFDTAVARWANSWVGWRPWADALIVFRAEYLGYVVIAGFLIFGVLTFLPRFSRFRARNWGMIAVALAAAAIARFGLVELIRLFYNRPRPFEVLADLNQLVAHAPGGSFPSGHAAFYFALAAVVARYYPKTSILFFIAALRISFDRVALGLHWPSDIVGGAVIGIVVGLGTHWLARKFLKSKTPA